MATYSIEIRSSDGATVRDSISINGTEGFDFIPYLQPEANLPSGLLADLTPERLRTALAYELTGVISRREDKMTAREIMEARKRLRSEH